MVGDILDAELARAGVELSNYMCEHFSYSRAELCNIVKVKELETWEDVLDDCGNGF
jgi:nitrite reductase (NADH) large subunit